MLNRGVFLVMSLALLYYSPVSCRNTKFPNVWVRQADRVCDMTPPGLRDSFSASCNRLLMNISTCSQAWNAFSVAFANRDPATVMNRQVGEGPGEGDACLELTACQYRMECSIYQ